MPGRQQYDNNMRGVLFENERKRGDKDPDMTGTLEIDGVKYWVSAWWKDGKNRNDPDYLSFAVREKDREGDRGGRSRGSVRRDDPPRGRSSGRRPDPRDNGPDPDDDLDGDIPF